MEIGLKMKRHPPWLVASFALLLIASAGCSLVVPIPVVGPPVSEQRMPYRVLVVVDDELKESTYSTSQMGTSWRFPLGEVLPGYITRALRGVFQQVDLASAAGSSAPYDIAIVPRLRRFEVVVPATIFSQTQITAELHYAVDDVRAGKRYNLSAIGTEAIKTDRDRELYEQLTIEAPQIMTGVGSYWVAGAERYEYLAARDTSLALLHCVDELNAKLSIIFVSTGRR